MLLTMLAFLMIAVFMAVIMTGRMSVLTALVVVPIVFATIGGFGPSIGPMVMDGLQLLAPTGVMLLFAILYFSLMVDAGLFEPMVRLVVRVVDHDPMKIVVGTAVLTAIASLDGDGSTTYLIVTAAMLPLYQRLGMSRLVLASVVMQAGGVMNILPWGGPTARAASALRVDVGTLFVPMIPPMAAALAWVMYVAYRLGMRERARLAAVARPAPEPAAAPASVPASVPALGPVPARPARAVPRFNVMLTVALLVALAAGLLPLPLLFMIAFALALAVNHPTIEAQQAQIAKHAGNAVAVVAVIFAAGILTGILSGTRMVDAMATSIVALVPAQLGPQFAIVTALLSLPCTFFLSNDAFYFGVLPILNQAAAAYGIGAAEMGRASLVGQPVHLLSPLVPSTYLLVGLAGVQLGDHQRFTLKWSIASSLVLLAIGLATLAIPTG